MGNCLRLLPSTPPAAGGDTDKSDSLIEKNEVGDSTILHQKGENASTEVRIRISKKQLEELLRRAEVKGLEAKDVLLDLINVSLGNSIDAHEHQWRPVLNCIAEEPECLSEHNHSRSY
ncbi:hypothetical protein KSP40_PGU016905 [Platanthera guangdongensis]|uniref:Ribbon-helix-helix protein CopG domain-containing protein n=1 Tax=Platanthera guangdongensis TaxID=2320717 RepID=A0ABR2N0B4_9ASPA